MDRDSAPELETAVATRYRRDDPKAFVLTVTAGPNAGEKHKLDSSLPSPLLVGQSPVCDLRLDDRLVSRRHVSLDIVDGRVKIVDLGSTNGTRVNGVTIGEAYLSGGEEICIGESRLQLDEKTESAVAPARPDTSFGRLIGASPAMQRLYPLLARLAASSVPLVIEGETGTGKEVLAESLHLMGPRADGPFVVLDCTAVSPTLMEAELFGHERGAFTGAVGSRKGVFEQAHGGTLLIDEIGDLELSLQPKLLRALERSEVRRIGADRPTKVDVRLLAATRRDLDQAVQLGRFRDDLFHRLAVARVALPPLRDRRGDIGFLVDHFCREFGSKQPLPASLVRSFQEQPWPGNVRELRNAVARYLAIGELESQPPPESESVPPDETAPVATSDAMAEVIAEQLPLPVARAKVVREFERRYIENILEQHGGDVAAAARASGIARRYFQLLRSGKRRA